MLYSAIIAVLRSMQTHIVRCHRWTVATDWPPRYFRYCWQHRHVQICGSSKSWRGILFRLL